MSKKFKRPEGITDLDILWAIRDIPKSILSLPHKGVLSMLLAAIGNREYLFGDMRELENIFGISDRRLRDHFHALEILGFIYIDRPKHYQSGKTNKYYLNYNKILTAKKKLKNEM